MIVDSINGELQKRLAAYASIAAKFGCLRKLKDLPDDQVVKIAEIIQKANHTDLEASDELSQFSSFLNTELVKKSLDVIASPAIPATSSVPAITEVSLDEVAVVTEDDDDVRLNVESLELLIYRLLEAK